MEQKLVGETCAFSVVTVPSAAVDYHVRRGRRLTGRAGRAPLACVLCARSDAPVRLGSR
jgi:hypothetical protein